jgi:hypothetical protein
MRANAAQERTSLERKGKGKELEELKKTAHEKIK